MPKLIEATTVGEGWVKAAEHLLICRDFSDFNVLIEVSNPEIFAPVDVEVMRLLDALLVRNACDPINTVAGTLFPAGLYKRGGFEKMCEEYHRKIYPRIKKNTNNRWGTYFARATSRKDRDGNIVNPLG